MENNKDNSKPAEQTAPDPLAPAENLGGLNNEMDVDDAVHFSAPKPSEENKQQDGDDAVHKNYKPAKVASHENDERDPDDAVHGKM